MTYKPLRVIISGGGTGGHIFPAVSIAGKLKELNPETEILFVGAEGKMEMEKVPAAGYEIVGLPMLGLQRQLNMKNIINDIKVPFKVLQSIQKAGKVIDGFKPVITVAHNPVSIFFRYCFIIVKILLVSCFSLVFIIPRTLSKVFKVA